MEWPELISNVGFPIAMVLWFMFRTDKVITKNTEAINRMIDKMN